jgi:hypothetical protein
MCLRRAPEKYIAGAALDRAAVEGNNFKIIPSHFLRNVIEQDSTPEAIYHSPGQVISHSLWKQMIHHNKQPSLIIISYILYKFKFPVMF